MVFTLMSSHQIYYDAKKQKKHLFTNMLEGYNSYSSKFSNASVSQQLTPTDVADLCYSKFKSLPKTGKPKDNEWTVLAGVVLCNNHTGTNEVISLGCGTKCIGKSKLCPKGLILNDSHAEVLSRRALLRYLYYHIKNAIAEESTTESIFQWLPENNKCKLKDGLSMHFFSTQTPCGDACIISSTETDEPLNKRRKVENAVNKIGQESVSLGEVYTGAKLLGTIHNDSMEQVVGAVRTKPGRGERTLSMSCSDKLAKWQVMGVQGALLDLLLNKPIYFKTLDFCGLNNLSGLERAVWKRFDQEKYNCNKYRLHVPKIRICSSSPFEHAQENYKQPSPNGLSWCNIPESFGPYEISVDGKRQGVTKKHLNTPSAALSIARCKLFREFVDILKTKPAIVVDCNDLDSKTYLDMKMLATEYQKAWNVVKSKYFIQWSSKPIENLKFSVVSNP